MFSNFVIGLVIGAGCGTWVYTKFQRSSGGNTKNSAIAAVITALLIAAATTIILGHVLKSHK
jgi:uncharacterized membrane protein YeaQ/YmgE (transglycosylase-associated protein family)